MTTNWTLNTILLNETFIIHSRKIAGYLTNVSPNGPNLGSAILIKRHIIHTRITIQLDCFLSCKIPTSSGLIVIATTCAFPREEPSLHFPFNTLKNYNIPFFFLGDLNARNSNFGFSSTNISAVHLFAILKDTNSNTQVSTSSPFSMTGQRLYRASYYETLTPFLKTISLHPAPSSFLIIVPLN